MDKLPSISGKISLIALKRYMQKSHFAWPCPLHVISLTHAIKDYLWKQITELNPWPSLHLDSHALRYWPITLNK